MSYTKAELINAIIVLMDLDNKYKKELNNLSRPLIDEMYEGLIDNARAFRNLKEGCA